MLRRGQITLFVILGLVLLLIAGLILLRPAPLTPEAEQASARVSSLVQSCLATTGESALRYIATQGGYADVSRFKNTHDQRTTQIIDVEPQHIVLWHEIHPCNENPAGCIGNNRPPLCREESRSCPTFLGTNEQLPSIEQSLEEEIARRLVECYEFERVLPDLQVEQLAPPVVDATIREDDILLDLEQPLRITTPSDEVIERDEFSSSIDVALPRLYRLATQLHATEVSTAFVEEAFLHLLAIYSGVDTPLPPMRDIELFGAEHFWVRTNVQRTIEDELLPYMNFLTLYNAEETFAPLLPPETIDPDYAPYAQGAYQYLIVKLDNETHPLGAHFEYPYTPMYLDINGKELLKPQKLSGAGGFLARLTGMLFTQYKFRYTLAFPIAITLEDPAAFAGRGLEFTFGLEANIYRNNPLNTSVEFAEISAGRSALDLADPSQLVDHTYHVTVTDRRTREGIENLAVSYECGVRVQIGITNASGVWEGKLPYCFTGGAIVLESAEYLGDGAQLDNVENDGGSTELSFSLWPRQQKLVRLYKRTPADQGAIIAAALNPAALTQYRTQLSEKDFSFLSLTRMKENALQDDAPLVGTLQFGATGTGPTPAQLRADLDALFASGDLTREDYDLAITHLDTAGGAAAATGFVQEQIVDLVPGTYALEGMLVYNGDVVIAPKVTSDYTINGTIFDTWVSGGVVLVSGDAFTLTPADVYDDAPLILYVIEQPLPRIWDDVENYQDIEEYQTYDRKTMVYPTFG